MYHKLYIWDGNYFKFIFIQVKHEYSVLYPNDKNKFSKKL